MTRQAGFSLSITVQPQPTRNVTVSWDAGDAANVTLDGAAVGSFGTKTELFPDGHTFTLAGDMNVALTTISSHINVNISPFPPTNVVGSSIDSANASVSWNCSSPNLTGFNIDLYNATNDSLIHRTVQTAIAPGGSFSKSEANLTAGASYYWKISAFDNTATSPEIKSNTVTLPSSPLVIPPQTPPSGNVGTAYNYQVIATGGTNPDVFSVAAGSSLPGGLSISSSGLITGTPTTQATSSTIIDAHDSSTPNQNASQTLTFTINGAPPSGLRVLPTFLANGIAKAQANDAAWIKLKSDCDRDLPVLLNVGSYEGSWLTNATNFAMAARCATEVGDTVRANKYTLKSVGIVKSALRDYQQAGWGSRQLLAIADGNTTRFQLADAPVTGSVPRAYAVAVGTAAIVKTSAVSDTIAWYVNVLVVSDNADGTSPYTENVDWRHTGDLMNNQLEWIVGGRKPTTGATYYVRSASPYLAALRTVTIDSTTTPPTIVFATAPVLNTAIFVEYVRTDYSQTGAGVGGLNNAMIDGPGFPTRYLGLSVAPVFDWCSGHSAVEAIRAEAASMLVRWSDYATTTAYEHDSIQSNYGCGHYVTRVLTGVLLAGTTDGDRVLASALSFRTNKIIPQLTASTISELGGWWAEGWNYGSQAVFLIAISTQALADVGQIDATPEKTWFNGVCEHIAHATLSPTTIIPFGTQYAYPAPRPTVDSIAFYAYLAADPAKGGLLSDGMPTSGWRSMALDALPPKVDSSTLGLSQWNLGTGCMLARTGWDSNRVLAAWISGNLLNCDHQEGWASGSFGLWRGNDDLLVAERWISHTESISLNSQHSNVLVADDGGTGLQNYRFNQGVFYLYGGPGVVILAEEETADYVRTAQDCKASYTKAGATIPGGSLSQWVRHWVFLKSFGTLLVCDFYTLKTAACAAWVRINFSAGAAATIAGDTFTIDRGASRLVGQVLSADTVTYFTTPPTGWKVPMLDAKTGLLTGTSISVFQTGASGATIAPAIRNVDGSVTVNGKTITFNVNGSITFV